MDSPSTLFTVEDEVEKQPRRKSFFRKNKNIVVSTNVSSDLAKVLGFIGNRRKM